MASGRGSRRRRNRPRHRSKGIIGSTKTLGITVDENVQIEIAAKLVEQEASLPLPLETIGEVPTKELIEAKEKEQEPVPQLGWLDSDDGSAHVIAMQQAARRNWSAAWRLNSVVNPWDSVEGLPPPGQVS